MSYKILKKRRS